MFLSPAGTQVMTSALHLPELHHLAHKKSQGGLAGPLGAPHPTANRAESTGMPAASQDLHRAGLGGSSHASAIGGGLAGFGHADVQAPAPSPASSWLAADPLFAGADQRLLARLSTVCEIRHLPRGAAVFRHGESADGLILIAIGRVRLVLPDDAQGDDKTLRGRVLASLGAGDSFGETALFLPSPTPLQARVVEPTTLIQIPRNALLPLMNQHPWLALRLLKRMSERLDQFVREIAGYSRKRAGSRLANYLLDQAEANAELARQEGTAASATGDDRLEVKLRDAKRAIASRLAIAPETLSRELRSLRDDGVIDEIDGVVTILDLERLRQRAQGD